MMEKFSLLFSKAQPQSSMVRQVRTLSPERFTWLNEFE